MYFSGMFHVYNDIKQTKMGLILYEKTKTEGCD